MDLHGVVNTGSVYATDTLTLNRLSLTLSGRFNRTTIDNHDRLEPTPGNGSLTGINSFSRFNPAVGLTYNLGGTINTYFSYSEGNRAPTSIELGCADPNTPCRLPNALAGDPPLKQVVTRTLEAGLRGGGEEDHLSWSAGWFRAMNGGFDRINRLYAPRHVHCSSTRAPINGDFPMPSATFYAPGAPIGAWGGVRIKF